MLAWFVILGGLVGLLAILAAFFICVRKDEERQRRSDDLDRMLEACWRTKKVDP